MLVEVTNSKRYEVQGDCQSMSVSISASARGVSAVSKNVWLKACLFWGLATLFYFYDNLLQISPSAMKPELFATFVRDAEQFGSLSAYCLYAYGLMQIPAGLLMDRFGPRQLLTVACVLCAIGSLLFGTAVTIWEAKFGRVMIGIGASFALVSCLNIASQWFPANRFALITGLTVTVGFLGAVFGLSTVSGIVAHLGWRETMQWGGIFGLILAFFLWILIRDKNEESAERPTEKPIATASVFSGLLQVIQHKQTWIAALYAGLMFVPTLAFGGLWGIPFLVEAHGFTRASAGMCISMIYLGWVFGGPFWGFISDYYKRRNLPMMIATLFTLLNCLAVIYLENLSVQTLSVLLFVLGFSSSGFILAFAVVRESNSALVVGTALGFMNALNTFWGALAQPVIGKILDMSVESSVTYSGVERTFNLMQYQKALMALPICLCVSLVMLFFLKETFCETGNVD